MKKKLIRLSGIKYRFVIFIVNAFLSQRSKGYFEAKRKLLNSVGYQIGEGSKLVGPIEANGKLIVGSNCWIGKNLRINGNGSVIIGDNCDIGPEVTFQTGGHEIGDSSRRAGKGLICSQRVGNGVWIGGGSTIIGNTTIGDSSVIAGCACVVHDVEANVLVGGVPAKVIRRLDDDTSRPVETKNS